MKCHYLLVVLVLLPFIESEASSQDGLLNNLIENVSPRIMYVGEIDGKHFYYQPEGMSYFAAKEYCQRNELLLAYFDNNEESEWVKRQLPIQNYWTNARDTFQLRDFRWTHNSGVIPIHSFAAFADSDAGLLLNNHTEMVLLSQERLDSDIHYPLCCYKIRLSEIPQQQQSISKSHKIVEKIDFLTSKSIIKNIKKKPTEGGKVSHIMNRNISPRLEFAGETNGKTYYYGTTPMNRQEAIDYCYNNGIQLAYFDSVAESNVVWEYVPSAYFWTNGRQEYGLEYFRWEHNNGEIPEGHYYAMVAGSLMGLTFSGTGGQFARHLVQTNENSKFYPLCLERHS